jgi:hypothetical protein
LLATAVLLKLAIHGVTVSQGRYFLAATALELLAIALAGWAVARSKRWRLGWSSFVSGIVIGGALFLLAPRMMAAVRRHDTDIQRSYRFSLQTDDRSAQLNCSLRTGLLSALNPSSSATIRILPDYPRTGDSAVASCEFSSPQRLMLRIFDSYPEGGLPGRVVQRVLVNGVEVFRHDVAAESGTRWSEIPLPPTDGASPVKVGIEVIAEAPANGLALGPVSQTEFQITNTEELR